MYKKDQILKITNKILEKEISDFEDNDIFITDLKISQDNRITLLIDSFKGIKIKDCALLSKKIEQKLDREKEDFELTVSSAGLDNPFTVKKQYFKNIGKKIKITTKEGKTIKGILKEANEEKINIETEKTKKENNKIQEIKYDNIKETKIVITF